MKKRNLENNEEIQNEIINHAIIWASELNQGNDKKANRHNTKIYQIISIFKEDKDKSKEILIPLLQHHDPSVRLFASIYALYQEIEIDRSVKILENLANDQNARGISLMAYINLIEWRKKNQNQ